MTQLECFYDERVSSDAGVTSASYADISVEIPSADLVAGKSYLILARGEIKVNALNARGGIRLNHGSTTFDGSTHEFSPTININEWSSFFFFDIWTAVAGEKLVLQLKSNGTARTDYQFTNILAIRLSDSGLVSGTHYHYNKLDTDTTLTSTLQTGGTITFTPATGGQNWLVLSRSRLALDVTDDEYVSRLDQTGGTTANWEMVHGGSLAGDSRSIISAWMGPLTAVSHTFREQSRRIGTGTGPRGSSAVLALNLAAFDVASFVNTDAHVDVVDTTQYGTEVASVGHTQAVASGLVWVLGFAAMDPQDSSSNPKYYYNRLQRNNIDVFSADGAANTYSNANAGRTHYPNAGDVSPGQVWPYVHSSLETLAAGASTFSLDASISAAAAGRGVKFRRILALSLDVAGAGGGGGTGGTLEAERNTQKMYLHDYRAARRRVRVKIRAADGSPITSGAVGTQGGISKNGAAYTTTGVGLLVAEESSNGLYYAELTAAALDELGSYRYRVAVTGAVVETVVFPVEPLPWLYDGLATGAGANYVDLSSPPSFIQPGSVLEVVDGPGAGESMLVQSFSGARATMESTWTTQPTSASRIIVWRGLPPVIQDVNAARVAGSTTAAENLREGASAMAFVTVQAGANSPTQVVTNLPTIVGGATTAANFYAGVGIIMRSGPLQGDRASVIGSAVSGGFTVLTLDPSMPLSGTPAAGATLVVT